MIPETIEGFRRSAFKSKHFNLVQEKVDYFESRGIETKVMKGGGYHYIYIKDDEPEETKLKEVKK